MKSPAQQKIIQIDITNACFNKCSNCTRFCGNHQKPFYMTYKFFQQACESLQDYTGMVGVMGGEPTLHPQFDLFVKYYANAFARRTPETNRGTPIENICEAQNREWGIVDGRRRGLWTSLGPGYRRHYALIRQVFEYQCINDHKNAGEHQAIMVTRKELGFSDADFFKLRDACWVQNLWSAAITPKGAFFCEVAAAMDMLLDGPGGWPVEPGWWRRTPDQFGSQLNWCELCSIALPVPYIPSNQETDLVSPEWGCRLKEIGSTKPRIIMDLKDYDRTKYRVNNKPVPYLVGANEKTRVAVDTSLCLAAGHLNAVIVCVGYADTLKLTLPYNMTECDRIVVVTTPDDAETIKVCEQAGAWVVTSARKNYMDAVFNKGAMINDGIRFLETTSNDYEWILLTDADCILPAGAGDYVRKRIFNSDYLYYAERVNVNRDSIKPGRPILEAAKRPAHDPAGDKAAFGYFQFFSTRSSALKWRDRTYYEETYYSAGHVDNEFRNLWHPEKHFLLPLKITHIYHGALGKNWQGIKK